MARRNRGLPGAAVRLGCFAFFLTASGVANADAWTLDPSVYLGVLYSDNQELRAGNETSGTGFEFRPQLLAKRDGPKWDALVNYRFNAIYGQDRGDEDEIFHYLNAISNYDFIEDRFGVALTADVTQQVTDPGEPVSFSNFAASANLTEVGTIALDPYFQFTPGKFTVGRISYRYGLLEYDDPLLNDSKEGRAVLTLRSAPPSAPWNWSVYVTDSNVEYDDNREVTLRRASVDLGWALTPRMDLVLNIGEDDNDLDDFPTQNDIDGSFWLAGLRGTIGSLTSYEVRVGRQFFGDSYLLQFERGGRRLTTTISYNEDTTTLAGQQLDFESLLGFLNEVGGFDLPAVSQDIYIRKRFNLSFQYATSLGSWQLSLFDEDRDFLTTVGGTQGDGSVGARFLWSYQYNARTGLSALVDWQESDLRDQGVEPQDIRIELNLRRELSRKGFATLRFFRNQRGNTFQDAEYEENGAAIGFGYEF